ncbi:MAG: ROK family transcriptional regulator [Candidatus Marinimicrobia bacterium]|jgi:predicted NBD/HSP70 family sugar kinase|nr:ROK family transcriptional regulator [Candidatus Neomarinimicrobiota bacterium]MBT3574608.1 ROK family transcriptional regulator [Candidatus Neomarinimicrobiota bacterium]MBT3680322.1 ROK family transcriptional regulator [Candidatus Neomarinimicrobiota bacterium]MBT3950930.1 ROK family transcriptional regulator [Candidatus Neomarinimicrobiota bacterium]MBT4252222.1 ROK family transcriptional regulator [Candidatus Neomarinimicrobiota bacterium]
MDQGKVQSYDFRLIRNINDRIVLNLILENESISGADLARLSGMQPSTISNILKGLKKRDLVNNLGKGESTFKGGKRPFLWEINSSAAYALGLDVEIGQTAIALLGLNGDVKKKKIYKTNGITNPRELSQHLLRSVNDLIKDSGVDLEKILGAGIAIAGIVNRGSGEVMMTDIIPQMNFSITSALQKKYQFPVIAENNANASAIGSKVVGTARGERNFMTVLIKVDAHVSGIGIGLVLNGELYHGTNYCSGEVTPEYPPMYNMISRLRDHFNKGKILKKYLNKIEDLNIRMLIDAANKGDALAIHYFMLLGRLIGSSIAKHIAMINPARVIITGDVAEVGDIILDPIKELVSYELVSVSKESLSIVASKSGRYSVAVGAASIILDEFLKVPAFTTNRIANLS